MFIAIKKEKRWDKEDTWNFVDEEVEWDEEEREEGDELKFQQSAKDWLTTNTNAVYVELVFKHITLTFAYNITFMSRISLAF